MDFFPSPIDVPTKVCKLDTLVVVSATLTLDLTAIRREAFLHHLDNPIYHVLNFNTQCN